MKQGGAAGIRWVEWDGRKAEGRGCEGGGRALLLLGVCIYTYLHVIMVWG